MAIYQTGATAIHYIWANVIGNTLVSTAGTFTSTSFLITDSDGNQTKVTGTGFTYNAGTTAVTGGTVTGLQRLVGGNPNGEQITGASVSATLFWADLGSAKISEVLNGADTFKLSQTQLSSLSGYAINGYGGGGLKAIDETGLTSDTLVFTFGGLNNLLFRDATTTGLIIPTNINCFTGGSGLNTVNFTAQPTAAALTLNGGTTGVLEMSLSNINGATKLDLRTQSVSSFNEIEFNNTLGSGGGGFAVMELNASQFGASGISLSSTLLGETTANPSFGDALLVAMTGTSFDASGFIANANFTNAHGLVVIDGSSLSTNLTMTGGSVDTQFQPGSGNDTIHGGTGNDIIIGSAGNDTVNGGTGAGINTVDYSTFSASPGLTVVLSNAAGTVNKGGANGIDHLTNIQNVVGTSNTDVFYVDTNASHVSGAGGFDYLIDLSPN